MLRKLLWVATWGPFRRFVRATKDPKRAQELLWKKTWAQLSRAPFWRGKGPRLEDFEISDYGTYHDAFVRDFEGKTSSLSGADIIYWAESSGTTGKRKMFPLTEAYRQQFQTTNLPLVHSLIRRFPGFLDAPVLYFAGIDPLEKTSSGIDVGFISNYNYRKIPPLAKKTYAFPDQVFKDTDTFFKWAPLYAVATDLSAMFAITPARIELFATKLAAQWEEYLPYLEGTKALPAPLPPVKVTAERLALLKLTLSGKRHFSFREIWPSLQFICVWKSAACGVQLPILDPYLQNQIQLVDATYSATEGWVNVPLSNEQNGGPVHPAALIVEFFPAGAPPAKDKILKMWELKVGEKYEIILTNIGGLIRYRLFDVVKCTGFFNRSPIIEFLHKSGSELALGMIRIGEHELVEALKQSGMPLQGRWVFGPSQRGDRLILFHDSPIENIGEYIGKIEETLARLNTFYKKDVALGTLKHLEAQLVAPDHKLWQRAEHAQTKPRPFVTESP